MTRLSGPERALALAVADAASLASATYRVYAAVPHWRRRERAAARRAWRGAEERMDAAINEAVGLLGVVGGCRVIAVGERYAALRATKGERT